MAITNAQQYQQLVNKPANGKRPGYRGDKGYQGSTGGSKADDRSGGRSSTSQGPAGGASAGGNYGGNVRSDQSYGGTKFEDQSYATGPAVNSADDRQKLREFQATRPEVKTFGLSSLFKKPLQMVSNFTTAKNRKFFQDVIRAGKFDYKTKDGKPLGFDMTEDELEDAYQNYMSSRLSGEIDAYGNPLNQGDDGGDPIIPLMAQAPSNMDQETEVEEDPFIPNFRLMADGGRAGFAEGGMPYEGGIMDLETSRQMYGLGKFVKKITRGVKKIAKSPIGKAALGAALFKFGGGFGKGPGSMFTKLFGANNTMPGFANISTAKMPGFLSKLGLTQGYGSMMPTALGGIAASTIGSYFMTPKEGDDDDEEFYAGADIADPKYIMNNPELFTNRRLAAEGGSMDEPVAKKTMPLLDMDGQEMDLRAEGGFVPLGRMERADDVPARLSKNEFVFTADAVRNAGEGDVDKGAEVMYNMMKNLESGGDVSEESQGLEGAREMFQTSQRLEEVI